MSRRFGVIIQPQLVMLQKTLLNIEGLGRELDPDLDLWKTAQPFLERWMSEQIGWRSLLKNLKAELPNWGTILPQLPRLVHSQLTASLDNPLSTKIELLSQQQRRNTYWLRLIAVVITLIAIAQIASLAAVWQSFH
jgi:ubiquinone biosynthesis protein